MNQATALSVPKWHKRLRRFCIICLSIFTLLIALFISIFYTSFGVHVTTYALDKFLPELKIAKIDGTLHNLKIDGLDLDLNGIYVKVDQAELSLSVISLLTAKLNINQFNADGVSVIVHSDQFTSSAEDSETEPKEASHERFLIKMPLPIYLDATHLSKVNVYVDDMKFSMSDFRGKAKWEKEKLYVYPSVAQDLAAIFSDSTTTAHHSDIDHKDLTINQQIEQIFNQPLIPSLPDVSLPLDINVESLTGDNWFLHIANEDYRFRHVTIQTDIIDNHIVVSNVETDAITPYATGHAMVSGNIILGNSWPLSANVNIKTAQDKFVGQFSGNLLGELNTDGKIDGVNQSNIHATINFVKGYMPLKIMLKGRYLQWPLMGQPEYQLSDFTVDSHGTLQKYQFMIKGLFKSEQFPDTSFDIAGNGTSEKALFDHAIVKFPQGEVDLKGQLSWDNQFAWDFLMKIDHVDLIKELPTYPIKLNGEFFTHGSFNNKNSEDWQIEISKLQLNGNIRKADFSAQGSLTANSSNLITANNLNLLWGKNRINLNGSTQKGDLVANLNLENLSQIMDNLSGTISGDIKMSGDVNAPTFSSHLVINRFNWQDIAINHANVDGMIHYQKELSGKVNVIGQYIDMPQLSINKANIELSGSEANHTLTVNINGQPVSMQSTLIGHMDRERKKWQGTLSDTSLIAKQNDNSSQNSWNLTKTLPISYDVAKESITIGAHCWVTGDSQPASMSDKHSICLDKSFTTNANSETTISINNIDLTLLPIPNDGETKLAGYLNGKATIRSFENRKIPSIKLALFSDNVHIKQMLASQELPIPFTIFAINFNLDEQHAKLDWDFALNQFGKIRGNLFVSDPMGKKGVNGNLIIDHLALSLINPLLEGDEYADGAINGNLKLTGSLMDPYVTGKIRLNQSEINTNLLPIDVTSAAIDLTFKGKSSTLTGNLTTKNGKIDIRGEANWRSIENWRALLTIKGSPIAISLPPMVALSVVPDIRLDASQKEILLSGNIAIPSGQITVESIPPSTVDVSSDEVMLDKNLKPVKSDNIGMNIKTDLTVMIGDNVLIDAFGLKASLTGNLRVRQINQQLGVFGQITIPQGRFLAYGQDLIIRKGIITFAGPTDQALLNVEAIRNPQSMDNNQVTAGIRVSGLSDDPKIEIFSDPAMSQQEALSYLLRGQGLESGEDNDNDMMTAMLVGLGTAKSGKFISNVGNIFGIKNLTLDTQGAGNSSKVVVSGYLLPDLQLKYGVGLFDAIATFTLRYRIMPKLYLEATSGLAQTLDLIYQMEF